MTGFKGYVYDSTSPDMPIIAAIFDADDELVKTIVVRSAEEGTRFIAEFLAGLGSTEDRAIPKDGI